MTSQSTNPVVYEATPMTLCLRALAYTATAFCVLFIFNNFLIFWQGWPGVDVFLAHYGLLGMVALKTPLEGITLTLGWVQILTYTGSIAVSIGLVLKTRSRPMLADSAVMASISAYVVRSAFWVILLIGIVDVGISFLRVEGFMEQFFGIEMAKELGRASYRGIHVHFPLVALGFIIGLFTRSLGFIWLAFLIVVAELMIVITRFVFSYEQAFMGDLVRFWYAGLFLFASAYTLIEEGHVRVDILYTGFSARGKAWTNTIGSLILGLPVCWIILIFGMWGKSNLINAPLLSYEVTQNGYGLFVKYLMAGFLMIYAVSMMIQFIGYFLSNASALLGHPPKQVDATGKMNSGTVLLDEQKA